MTTINQGDVGGMPVPLPSLDVQRAFTDKLDEFDEARRKTQDAIASANQLRRYILNQVMIG